jgi:hypothetical protein
MWPRPNPAWLHGATAYMNLLRDAAILPMLTVLTVVSALVLTYSRPAPRFTERARFRHKWQAFAVHSFGGLWRKRAPARRKRSELTAA